jgi:hypothetical protein
MVRGLGLLCWLLLLLNSTAFARTRENVLTDAAAYSVFPWKPETKNILDSYNLFRDSYVPVASLQVSTDGVDDRFFKWNDKVTPPRWEYSKSNWPFEVCSTCTYHGEAYALGDDVITWGWESTSAFKARLEHVSERWIAGRTRSAQTLPTSGYYTGFTGIDCSGFVSRLWATENPPLNRRHLGTGEIPGYTLSIDRRTQLKPGDILNKPGKPGVPGHVVVFLEWEEEPVTAKIVHAAPRNYAENHLSADVHYDRATLTGDIVQPGTIDVRYNSGYDARSAFPQFAWTSPTKEKPELDPLVPVIELAITSKQNVVVSSVTLVIDEGTPGAVVITPGTTGYALAPSTSNSTHVSVRYEFPPDLALSSGPHSVTAYAGNIIGLTDISSMTFQVVPGTDPPTIAWADYGGPGELFGSLKGANTIETAPWLHTEGVLLQLRPDRNLLRDWKIYADDGMTAPLSAMTFTAGARNVDIDTALAGFQEKTGYYARLADVMANTTTMYFHLDKVGPVIESTVTVRLGGGSFVFDAAGRALDGMSGLNGAVALATEQPPDLPEYTGPSWPPGPLEAPYAFTDLQGAYSLQVYDRAGWPGQYHLNFSTWTQNLRLSNLDADNNHIGAGNAGTYGDMFQGDTILFVSPWYVSPLS